MQVPKLTKEERIARLNRDKSKLEEFLSSEIDNERTRGDDMFKRASELRPVEEVIRDLNDVLSGAA